MSVTIVCMRCCEADIVNTYTGTIALLRHAPWLQYTAAASTIAAIPESSILFLIKPRVWSLLLAKINIINVLSAQQV